MCSDPNALNAGFRKKNIMRAGVWLARSPRAWSCNDCDQVAGLRTRRGDCGGRFTNDVPHGLNGRVPGYRIAPDSDEEFSEVMWDRCPVALSSSYGYVYQIYGALQVDGITLRDIISQPTTGLIDALAVIERSSRLAHRREIERHAESG